MYVVLSLLNLINLSHCEAGRIELYGRRQKFKLCVVLAGKTLVTLLLSHKKTYVCILCILSIISNSIKYCIWCSFWLRSSPYKPVQPLPLMPIMQNGMNKWKGNEWSISAVHKKKQWKQINNNKEKRRGQRIQKMYRIPWTQYVHKYRYLITQRTQKGWQLLWITKKETFLLCGMWQQLSKLLFLIFLSSECPAP